MIFDCWVENSWQPNAWEEDAWCPAEVCTPAPIGNVWASNSWEDTAWCIDTWANATPPVPPVPVRVEARRWPGPSIVIYDEWEYKKKRRKEEEEIVIL